MNRKGQQVGYISLLVLIFICVVVGTALLPTIASNTATATNTTGISGTPSETLLNLNTLMYSLLIMGTVAGLGFIVMRITGLI